MLCQNCGKNNANTHFSQNINGNVTESWLCSECAEKLGIGGMFSSFGSFGSFGFPSGFGLSSLFGLNSLLGSAFGGSTVSTLPEASTCPQCGSSFSDIAERGMVGCPECYSFFADSLAPSIERIHGKRLNDLTSGKNVRGAAQPKQTPERKSSVYVPKKNTPESIEQLKLQLKQAIVAEEYEKAAVLRDRIKQLETN